MRYVILGANGMLGHDLIRALENRDVAALGRDRADLTDPAALRAAIAGADVVINAAAYTRVDDAETDEAAATAINGTGAGDAARAASEAGARFVQISTDYVFDGSATTPYLETTPRRPISAYGRSKAEGERLVAEAHPAPHIVRTSWLYGENGPNFPRTMLTLAAGRETVDVVADQIGQPTWTHDLARGIVELLDAEAPAGTYHATNSGAATWFDFARATFELFGLDPDRVHPTDSATFVRPAPRPAYSVLGHAAWLAAGLSELRPWREALADAVAQGAVNPR
jgi:dTDP-4-dehydrorhamnose reductase